MKPDGLVTVLGEACVNGKAEESTEHPFFLFFNHNNIIQLLQTFLGHLCELFVPFSVFINHYICR